jgi:hypothetical protein
MSQFGCAQVPVLKGQVDKLRHGAAVVLAQLFGRIKVAGSDRAFHLIEEIVLGGLVAKADLGDTSPGHDNAKQSPQGD